MTSYSSDIQVPCFTGQHGSLRKNEIQNDFENFMKLQQCDITSIYYLPKSELLKFTQLIFTQSIKNFSSSFIISKKTRKKLA